MVLRCPNPEALSMWHTWFAWHPVRIFIYSELLGEHYTSAIVWLQTVERRRIGGQWGVWEHRFPLYEGGSIGNWLVLPPMPPIPSRQERDPGSPT